MAKTVVTKIKGLGSIDADAEKRIAKQVAEYDKQLRKQTQQDLYKLQMSYAKKLNAADEEDKKKLQEKLTKKEEKIRKAREEEAAAYSLYLTQKNLEKEKEYRKSIQLEMGKMQAKTATNWKDYGKGLSRQLGAAAENLVGTIGKSISGSVEKYLDLYVKYYSSITARLQNSGLSYTKINDVFKARTAANPYFKYETLLENLATLVEAGIADNVSQRAFFGVISDKVATTFNVAQESMLNIIRIQQADTTAARLGMEANLTRLFNSYFRDTSYLNQLYDTVQSALIDTSAMFPQTEASIEFEYIVQKWLGSLSSVGATDSTLTALASAINALATGDVDYFASNPAMQNLLVMAANKVNLDYGNLLTRGVSTTQVNDLMVGVIEYIKSILNSNNNVVKKQYAQLFGVTVSDLAAFTNLTSDTIKKLHKTVLSYDGTLKEVESQLSKVASRTHVSELIQNVLDNTMASVGMGVANSELMYSMYKAADMVEKITGGINLPAVGILGNFVDLNMSLEGLIKGGILGISTVTSLVSAVSNMFNGKFLDPDQYKIVTSGEGFTTWSKPGELIESTSASTTVSNTDSTGVSQSLAQQQKETGESVSGDKTKDVDMEKEYYIPYKNSMEKLIELLQGTLNVYVTNSTSTKGPGNSALGE